MLCSKALFKKFEAARKNLNFVKNLPPYFFLFENNYQKRTSKVSLKKTFPHAYLFFLSVGTRSSTVLCSKAFFRKFEAARKNLSFVGKFAPHFSLFKKNTIKEPTKYPSRICPHTFSCLKTITKAYYH